MARNSHAGTKITQSLNLIADVPLLDFYVAPKFAGDCQLLFGSSAHRLSARQFGCKGTLTSDADLFHPRPHLFLITNTAVP